MELLCGWTAIGRAFETTGKVAKEWYAKGAPILLLGEKPVTALEDLWPWLLKTYGGPDREPLGMSAAEAKAAMSESGEHALLLATMNGRTEKEVTYAKVNF